MNIDDEREPTIAEIVQPINGAVLEVSELVGLLFAKIELLERRVIALESREDGRNDETGR